MYDIPLSVNLTLSLNIHIIDAEWSMYVYVKYFRIQTSKDKEEDDSFI